MAGSRTLDETIKVLFLHLSISGCWLQAQPGFPSGKDGDGSPMLTVLLVQQFHQDHSEPSRSTRTPSERESCRKGDGQAVDSSAPQKGSGQAMDSSASRKGGGRLTLQEGW